MPAQFAQIWVFSCQCRRGLHGELASHLRGFAGSLTPASPPAHLQVLHVASACLWLQGELHIRPSLSPMLGGTVGVLILLQRVEALALPALAQERGGLLMEVQVHIRQHTRKYSKAGQAYSASALPWRARAHTKGVQQPAQYSKVHIRTASDWRWPAVGRPVQKDGKGSSLMPSQCRDCCPALKTWMPAQMSSGPSTTHGPLEAAAAAQQVAANCRPGGACSQAALGTGLE